ncbi:hypothetical protein [Nocardioides albus]|uniref:Uncharacterized protein n=1 Tax=Nocardioides albus TaxID=1841 RepID=A0A7W5A2F4_9ACTN|nr:hypothetical protein [Nocardioides albus]MBB3088175.1 hypothetical protein [Nocardioides albus]GGU23001.1 hypothetical protein GCM10007979_22420 [Nocardioides albus]
MERAWRADGVYPADNWSEVPAISGQMGDEWIATECRRISAELGDGWTVDVQSEFRRLLANAVESANEAGTLLTILHWPVALPLISRVRVLLADGSPFDPKAWEGAGFDVSEFPGAELGPGAVCLASREVGAGDDRSQFHTAAYAFSSGSDGIAVIVESGSREVFELTVAFMPAILGNMRITQPNGVVFEAKPIPGITRDIVDEWKVANHA